ncbi:MAG: hypothetical protein ACUVWV_01845 [Thermodesulfobacteriota bacterium]
MMKIYSPQNLKYFYQSININLSNLMQELLALEDMREYIPEEIYLEITFRDSGEIESINTFPPEQNKFLLLIKNKILEKGIPSPRIYGLPNRELRLEIKIAYQRKAIIKTKLQ